MKFLVPWKNHELNRFFKLINKILLFKYSKGIFPVHTRALTLKLAHKPQLIKLLLKNWNFFHEFLFFERYKGMNILTIEIG